MPGWGRGSLAGISCPNMLNVMGKYMTNVTIGSTFVDRLELSIIYCLATISLDRKLIWPATRQNAQLEAGTLDKWSSMSVL
jgi:hypothetical protein